MRKDVSMAEERKIAIVGRTLSFAEAEDADDKFWAKASVEERWKELVNLRMMVFGSGSGEPLKMQKVVRKRSFYENDDES
jgi:hypothetical protein